MLYQLKRIPLLRSLVQRLKGTQSVPASAPESFTSSTEYWQARYRSGGNSGAGSYGKLAEFKAEVLNDFVAEQRIRSVIEFGCGDGNQLTLADYPRYLGYDISEDSIRRCQTLFAHDPTKSFKLIDDDAAEVAELSLSLDVIYHLVEDSLFEQYMRRLFDSATRYVIIYSSDRDAAQIVPHVRHRQFTRWVNDEATEWTFHRRIPNRYPNNDDFVLGLHADFFIYKKNGV